MPSFATTVCHTLSELAAGPTSATQVHYSSGLGVPQSGHNVSCGSTVNVASVSHSSAASVQHLPARSVQQSVPSCTVPTLQHSRCHATTVSSSLTPTVGLASAVWTPMGATLQHTPEPHTGEVNMNQPVCRAEQLRLLAVHHRLTISFNEEFSHHMNSIITVMHSACRLAAPHVFQYALDRLRLLRFKYCQLTEICVVYGEYQKHVRNNRSITLPTVSCLHSSIEILMNSVNAVTAVFHEMNQWLSTDTRMTVMERGLGLSNKLCHFVPVFIREMGNFKRSLQMIVPNTVSAPSASDAPVVPVCDTLPSLSSYDGSSVAAMLTAPSSVTDAAARLQEDENSELRGQNVEPIFVAPIVIEPDGQLDDEFETIRVKQEPVELDRKRRKPLAELIYVDDDDDSVAASAAESDDVSFMLASQFNADSLLTLESHMPAPASEHLGELSADNQLTVCQAEGVSSSGASQVVSAAAAHYRSSDISNGVNECINPAVCADTGDIATVMSAVSASNVLPVFTVHSAVATCTSGLYSTSNPQTSFCSRSSSSLVTVSTSEDCASVFNSMNVNCANGVIRASSGQQGFDIEPTVDASVTTGFISDSESGVVSKVNITQGSKLSFDFSDERNHSLRNGDRSSIENNRRMSSAEHCLGRNSSEELDDCLRDLDLNVTCGNNAQSNGHDIPSKRTAGTAAHNSGEPAPAKVSNIASAEDNDSNTLIECARSDMSDDLSDVNNLCTISSVCSIALEGFDSMDISENTIVDDVVTAVRAFDKNVNIVFDNVDVNSHDLHPQISELPHSLSVKTVQKKKKRVPASRFARRRKRRQRSKMLRSIGSKTRADSSVSDNLETVDEVNENGTCEETLQSAGDNNFAVTVELVLPDKEQFQSTVAACQDTAVAETGLKNVVDVTSELRNVSPDTALSSENITDAPATDLVANTDFLSESSASMSKQPAVDTIDSGSGCEESAGLQYENQDSGDCEEHTADVIEENCSKQLECESRDEDDDDERINSPSKKKRACVLYDEEDVENEESGNVASDSCVHVKTQTPPQANDAKKLSNVASNNTNSISEKVTEKDVVEGKLSKNKVKKQEQCKKKHHEEISTCVTTAASIVSKHNCPAIRKHKLKKSKQLLKRGVKQKTVHLVNERKAHKSVSQKREEKGQVSGEKCRTEALRARAVSERNIAAVGMHKLKKPEQQVKCGVKQKTLSLINESKALKNVSKKRAENGKVAVDKCVVTEASKAGTVSIHNSAAIRMQKLEKFKKLLKCDVKQQTHLVNGNKALINVNSGRTDATAKKCDQQRAAHILPMIHTVEKLSSQSTLAASAASVVSVEGQPRQSARDKVNAIFRNSEFTQLHGNSSLVHSKNKRAFPANLLSSSNNANDCSEVDDRAGVPSLKNSKISPFNSEHNVPKSGCVTGTAVTSSAVHSTYKPVAARPPVQSTLVISSTSVARSVASVKAKSGQNDNVDTSWVPQRKVVAGKVSPASSSTVVCSSAVNHCVQNTIPSLMSLNLKAPCTTMTMDVVSSINDSVAGSQPLNITSAAAVRDPRLGQRQQQLKSGSSQQRSAENLTTSTSAGSSIQTSSMQWPWEQTDRVASSTTHSSKLKGKGDVRNKPLPSRSHGTAGCWAWDTGIQSSRGDRSPLSIDVGDILSDLSTSCNLQDTSESNQWHSASRVVHNGSLVSPPFRAADKDHQAADSAAVTTMHGAKSVTKSHESVDNRKTENRREVKEGLSVPLLEKIRVNIEPHSDRHVSLLDNNYDSVEKLSDDIMSPVEERDSQHGVGNSFIQHSSAGSDAHVSVDSDSSFTSQAAAKSFSPHACHKDPGWQLIPSDSTDVCYSSKKPLCDRKKRSGHPSDPRLKATGVVSHSTSLTRESNVSGSVDWSYDIDFEPVDADSTPGKQQTRLTIEVDDPHSEMLPAAGSLDNRIDTFSSHLDAFSLDKNVEDQVDRLMSLWDEDVDDSVDMCMDNSLGASDDRHECVEDIDSDADQFIIIDSDSDDDKSGDELVIDLDSSDIDVKPVPSLHQSIDNDSKTVVSDSTSGTHQTRLSVELDDPQSETPPVARSLDNRINTFSSHLDTFSVDKNVEDQVDKLMSLWDEGLDSSCKTDTQRHTTKHDRSQNKKQSISTASRTDRGAFPDKDLQSVAEADDPQVDNPLRSRQERSLSTRNSSSGTIHPKQSVKQSECMKDSAAEGRGREAASESSYEYDASTSQYAVKAVAVPQFPDTTSACGDVVKMSENSGDAAGGEICGNSKEIHSAVTTSNTRKLPASFSVSEQNLQTPVSTDFAESHRKRYKTSVSPSATTVSACLACFAGVSEAKLYKLNLHMEARVEAAERKAAHCKKYACPLDDLNESEKRQLVADRLANPAVVSEFSTELRLQSLQREIDKTEATLVKIKSQFDPTHPSLSLEKKYDQHERVCNNLLVRRDWCYQSMNRLRRYYKSKFLLKLPDDLRFSSECGEVVSVEGVPLILNDYTVSLQHCRRLAALLVLIKHVRGSPRTRLSRDELVKLGWLHQQRKTLLCKICCSSPQKVGRRVESLSEKLTLYRCGFFYLL